MGQAKTGNVLIAGICVGVLLGCGGGKKQPAQPAQSAEGDHAFLEKSCNEGDALACKSLQEMRGEPANEAQPAPVVVPEEPSVPEDKPVASDQPAPIDSAVDESWWEDAVRFTEEMADLIDANKDDCTAMAKAFSEFIDRNQAIIQKGRSMQGDPETTKRYFERYRDRLTAAGSKMAAMGKCAAEPAMAEAMKKLQ